MMSSDGSRSSETAGPPGAGTCTCPVGHRAARGISAPRSEVGYRPLVMDGETFLREHFDHVIHRLMAALDQRDWQIVEDTVAPYLTRQGTREALAAKYPNLVKEMNDA